MFRDLCPNFLVLTACHLSVVTDNISHEKGIPNIVSVYLQPPTTSIQTVGSLTFGGVDKSKIKGPVHYMYEPPCILDDRN